MYNINGDKMKERILNILKENNNQLISGSSIAKKLNVTRSYVNKIIISLKEDGYNIEQYNRSGYIYKDCIKVIDEKEICDNINKKKDILFFEKINSTNTYLKEIAKDKTINNKLVIANFQSNGRGRLGRTFISEKTCGIYMSLLLRPDISLNNITKVTCLTAVAIKNAILELTNLNPLIKWVNDIYINNKKVSGILVESSIENNQLDYLIIGIGINVYKREFDESIKNIATSIEDEGNMIISRNELIAKIINNIDTYLDNFYNNIFMEDYRNSSCVIGKKVELNMHGKYIDVVVKDINLDGELIVDTKDEINKVIYSGEITRMVINDK